ncbi:helix-turn-helix domain-containing protein [Bradyrhizobium sp. SBR1B]|uniref:helix-turn-helix domain-containing protein n=1 Tax=Bradyrhizobium sp. SBR1B TaxID=2663836 RepID=UPI003908B9AA
MRAATGRVPAGAALNVANASSHFALPHDSGRYRAKRKLTSHLPLGPWVHGLTLPGLFTRSGARRWWMREPPRSTASLARDARSRVRHLICELAAAAGSPGIAGGRQLLCPVTQQHIADPCGLSVVDANRTIQELRQLRLVEWDRRTLTLLRRKSWRNWRTSRQSISTLAMKGSSLRQKGEEP